MIKSRLFKQLLAIATFVCGSVSAFAGSCTINNQYDYVADFGSTLVVPRTAAVGDVIKKLTFDTGYYIYSLSCSGGAGSTLSAVVGWNGPQSTGGAGGAHVYQTNVPGIGYRVYSNTTNAFVSGNQYGEYPATVSNIIGGGTYFSGGSQMPEVFTVELVKTGMIKPGVFQSGATIYQMYATADPSRPNVTIKTGSPTVVTNGTCLVNATQTVDMGKMLQKTLVPDSDPAMQGGSASALVPFSINLSNCGAADSTNVLIGFTGTPNATNPVLFANTAGWIPAENVGVNIKRWDTQANISPNTMDTWTGVSTKDGAYRYGARMVSTGPVKAGKVQSIVTVDVFYQ